MMEKTWTHVFYSFDWIWFWVSGACQQAIFRRLKSGWIYLAINNTIINDVILEQTSLRFGFQWGMDM